MITKVREWIIKKLGGYTESEYCGNRLVEYVPVKEEKIYTTLYSEQRFDKICLDFSGDDLKRYFIGRMCDQLLPYVKLNIEYLSDRERLVKAILHVVGVSGYAPVHEEGEDDN